MLSWMMGSRPHTLPYIALAAVCFFWGTTYTGIRLALESFPPFTLVALRFLISGTALLAWAKWKGWKLPEGRELHRTALLGMLLLGVSSACLTYSETLIPSGLAALFLTTAPFWLVGMDSMIPGGERVSPSVAAGLLVGLGGVILLLLPEGKGFELAPNVWKGFLILQFGSVFWNGGSILQRRWRSSQNPLVTGAIQQLAVGFVFAVVAAVVPQHPIHISASGIAGILWLATFGSIVGYSAYIYSLETLPVSLVSIYTYINPIVAVGLGWLLYGEPFGRKELAAMAVIFAGVLIIKLRSIPGRASSPQRPLPRSSEV